MSSSAPEFTRQRRPPRAAPCLQQLQAGAAAACADVAHLLRPVLGAAGGGVPALEMNTPRRWSGSRCPSAPWCPERIPDSKHPSRGHSTQPPWPPAMTSAKACLDLGPQSRPSSIRQGFPLPPWRPRLYPRQTCQPSQSQRGSGAYSFDFGFLHKLRNDLSPSSS